MGAAAGPWGPARVQGVEVAGLTSRTEPRRLQRVGGTSTPPIGPTHIGSPRALCYSVGVAIEGLGDEAPAGGLVPGGGGTTAKPARSFL